VRTHFIVSLLLLAACSAKKAPEVDPNVVAFVNERPITRVAFEEELASEAQAMEGTGARTPEQLEPFKRALLDTLIERELLLEAAAKANVEVSNEEIDLRMLALASEYPDGSFEETLAKSQTSKQALERKTKETLLVEKLFATQVFSRVAVTEAQLRAAYEAAPGDFEEAESVHALQLVVKYLDEAKRLQQQLWQGKKFQDLARRYSLSPDAKVGGDLGWFPRGQMPAAFDEAIFKLTPNQVSEVVSSDFGFHLFKLVEKRPARKREFNEVRDQLEKKLLGVLSAERQHQYLVELKGQAQLKVQETVLATISGRPSSSGGQEP
jgi:peptidyl-prolyl cis-trans isomerase C